MSSSMNPTDLTGFDDEDEIHVGSSCGESLRKLPAESQKDVEEIHQQDHCGRCRPMLSLVPGVKDTTISDLDYFDKSSPGEPLPLQNVKTDKGKGAGKAKGKPNKSLTRIMLSNGLGSRIIQSEEPRHEKACDTNTNYLMYEVSESGQEKVKSTSETFVYNDTISRILTQHDVELCMGSEEPGGGTAVLPHKEVEGLLQESMTLSCPSHPGSSPSSSGGSPSSLGRGVSSPGGGRKRRRKRKRSGQLSERLDMLEDFVPDVGGGQRLEEEDSGCIEEEGDELIHCIHRNDVGYGGGGDVMSVGSSSNTETDLEGQDQESEFQEQGVEIHHECQLQSSLPTIAAAVPMESGGTQNTSGSASCDRVRGRARASEGSTESGSVATTVTTASSDVELQSDGGYVPSHDTSPHSHPTVNSSCAKSNRVSSIDSYSAPLTRSSSRVNSRASSRVSSRAKEEPMIAAEEDQSPSPPPLPPPPPTTAEAPLVIESSDEEEQDNGTGSLNSTSVPVALRRAHARGERAPSPFVDSSFVSTPIGDGVRGELCSASQEAKRRRVSEGSEVSVVSGKGDGDSEDDIYKVHMQYATAYIPQSSLRSVPHETRLIYPNSTTPGAVRVTRSDMIRLQEKVYLNDTIIDFYLRYLLLNGLGGGLQSNQVHIFSPLFFEAMRNMVGPQTDAYWQGIKKWTKGMNLFEKKIVMFPINSCLHWSLAILCNPDCVKAKGDPEIPVSKSQQETARAFPTRRCGKSEPVEIGARGFEEDELSTSAQAKDENSGERLAFRYVSAKSSISGLGLKLGQVSQQQVNEEFQGNREHDRTPQTPCKVYNSRKSDGIAVDLSGDVEGEDRWQEGCRMPHVVRRGEGLKDGDGLMVSLEDASTPRVKAEPKSRGVTAPASKEEKGQSAKEKGNPASPMINQNSVKTDSKRLSLKWARERAGEKEWPGIATCALQRLPNYATVPLKQRLIQSPRKMGKQNVKGQPAAPTSNSQMHTRVVSTQGNGASNVSVCGGVGEDKNDAVDKTGQECEMQGGEKHGDSKGVAVRAWMEEDRDVSRGNHIAMSAGRDHPGRRVSGQSTLGVTTCQSGGELPESMVLEPTGSGKPVRVDGHAMENESAEVVRETRRRGIPDKTNDLVGAETRKKMAKEEAVEADMDDEVPCILLLDSIKGSRAQGVYRAIRSYVEAAWNNTQRDTRGEADLSAASLPSMRPPVPQQNNACDCGAYLLHFADLFLENPPSITRGFVANKSKGSMLKPDWFDEKAISDKRKHIRDLIETLRWKAMQENLSPNKSKKP